MSVIQKGMTSGRPINLIFTEKGPDGHHRLALNREAFKELKDVDEKLVVISAVGAYRTGKSYLLSRLAMASGSQGGTFEVGHTCEPKTKGLWIMLLNHPSMPGHKLLLVDTEGIGDTNKGDSQHDANLFVLTCLLSTILIYNGKNAIDEDAIKQFGFTAEMSKYVVSRSGQSKGGDISDFFPELVYVVRDFALDLEVDGRVKTPDEYLEHALSTDVNDAADRANVRKTITKYFRRRRCFTLDLPAANKRVLQRMDSLEDEGLARDFVSSMNNLFAYLMKERGGQQLNGMQLATLAETIVNSFEKNEVPNISSTMDILRNQENERVMDDAERTYEAGMKKLKLPMDSMGIVTKTHQKLSKQAIAQVRREAYFDDMEGSETLKKFQSKLNAKEAFYRKENERLSQELCAKTLNNLYSEIHAKRSTAYNCPGGHQKYKEDMLQLEQQFGAMTGLGPKKKEGLAVFLEAKRSDHDSILETDRRLTKKENEIIEQRRRQKEAERERKAAEKRRKELEAIERANEERERQNRAKAEALKRQLKEAKRQRRLVFKSVWNGDTCPTDALKAPDRNQSVVCLWEDKENGTFGRADVNHYITGLQAWFPWGGDEYDSKKLPRGFKVACRNYNDFDYTWERISVVKHLNETNLYEVNGYCPAVVDGLLGKANIRRGMAWTSWAGKEKNYTGNSFNTALALCVRIK